MKFQILFSRKDKKKCFKMSSAEMFTQHAKSKININPLPIYAE